MFDIEVMHSGTWIHFCQGGDTRAMAQSGIDEQMEMDTLERAKTGDLDCRYNYRIVRAWRGN